MLKMKQRPRIYYTEEQKALMCYYVGFVGIGPSQGLALVRPGYCDHVPAVCTAPRVLGR
jgi:hypothetical protein